MGPGRKGRLSMTETQMGARRRFKTRIGLLAQPNFTPPISGAKVLADASISASAAVLSD